MLPPRIWSRRPPLPCGSFLDIGGGGGGPPHVAGGGGGGGAPPCGPLSILPCGAGGGGGGGGEGPPIIPCGADSPSFPRGAGAGSGGKGRPCFPCLACGGGRGRGGGLDWLLSCDASVGSFPTNWKKNWIPSSESQKNVNAVCYYIFKPSMAGDKNISILHLSCRTNDLQISLILKTHVLVL